MRLLDEVESELHPGEVVPSTGRRPPVENSVEDASAVRDQLDRVLAGQSFRTSKRYSRFLRFVVEETLNGHTDSVKERVIATEVFGRPADYDSNVDPIVRVAAGEIRKRLAQYYVQPGREAELRIEFHAGSYVPSFVRPEHHATASATSDTRRENVPSQPLETSEDAAPAPSQTLTPRRLLSALSRFTFVVAALLIASAGFWFHTGRAETNLAKFWQPFFSGSATPYICVADILSVGKQPVPTLATDPTIREWIRGAEHVAYGDVTAFGELSGPFHRANRPYRLLMADSVNFSDLRGQPLVLIGGSDNPWTVHFLSGLRYTIHPDPGSGKNQILDTQARSKPVGELGFEDHVSTVTRDFGVISRFSNAAIGQPTLIVAGLGPYGTTAAAEFVTNPQYFSEFTQSAPRNWSEKNVQIVVETELVNGRSGPPHMVTYTVW